MPRACIYTVQALYVTEDTKDKTRERQQSPIVMLIIILLSSHRSAPQTCAPRLSVRGLVVKTGICFKSMIDSFRYVVFLVVIDRAVAPAMNATCSRRHAPAVPRCSYGSSVKSCRDIITNSPAITGAFGCQLASLTQVFQLLRLLLSSQAFI